MILKLQRSLFPRDSEVLVYNEDKSLFDQLPWCKEFEEMFGDDVKIYVHAHINENKILVFGDDADWQDW